MHELYNTRFNTFFPALFLFVIPSSTLGWGESQKPLIKLRQEKRRECLIYVASMGKVWI